MDLLKLPLSVIFHPAETFRQIKQYRDDFSYVPVIVLFILIIVVRTAFIFFVHFPLATIQPKDANVFLEMVKFLVPIITWAVSSYAVSSIIGGEALFKEVLMASAYALIPYIVLTIPIAGITRILSASGGEKSLFNFMNQVVWIWVGVLMFVSVKSMHDYHLGTTILVCLLSILGIALIWSLFILMYALTGNLRAFIQGLILEIWMSVRYG